MTSDDDFSSGTSYGVSPVIRVFFLTAEWMNFVVRGAVLIMFGAAGSVLVFEPAVLFFLVQTLGLLAAPIVGFSKLLYWINQRGAHRARAKRAQQIFDEIATANASNYCLYLRPFLTAGRLRIANSRYRRRFFPSLDRFFGLRIDLETACAIALERSGHPLIAIGETGFLAGAPKLITSDANWQAAFEKLSKAASAIIIVPLPRPSTLWELNYLLDHPDLLQKTMFVMPVRLRSGVQEKLEPFWEDVCENMERRGVRFPRLSSRGSFFFLSANGLALHQIDAAGFDSDHLANVLRGLVDRSSLDKSYGGPRHDDESAVCKIIDACLYIGRDDQLYARPVPLYDFLPSLPGRDLFNSLVEQGLMTVYRTQDGSQPWYEAQLHPSALDSKIIRAWASGNESRLRAKGKVVEACFADTQWQAGTLARTSTAELAVLETHDAQNQSNRIEKIDVPTFEYGYLRPDERLITQQAVQ